MLDWGRNMQILAGNANITSNTYDKEQFFSSFSRVLLISFSGRVCVCFSCIAESYKARLESCFYIRIF